MDKTVLSARVPATLAVAVEREATRRGVTATDLIRLALERELDSAAPAREGGGEAALRPVDRLVVESVVALRPLVLLMLQHLLSRERAELEVRRVDEALPSRVAELLRRLEPR